MIKNIKKLGVFLLTVILITALYSCNTTREAEPFSAFSGDIQAEVYLTLGESTSRSVFRRIGDTETVTFSEPNELLGYVFEKTGDKITLSYSGVSTEVSPSVGRIMLISSAVFSPSNDCISSISAKKENGEKFTDIVCKDITYRFLKDGTPISAIGSVFGVSFSAEIISVGIAK